jgi:hypothetical protein
VTLRVGIIGTTSTVSANNPKWRDSELQAFERYFLEEGVISGFAVSEKGSGANMTVDVAAGQALIEITNTNLTAGETYKVYFTSDAVENVPVTAADGTNPRKDRVVLRVDVSENPDTSAGNVAIVEILAGTPAGSPAAPAEPANAITLAIIDIPASDTTIGNAQITDSRTYVTADSAVLADLQRAATAVTTTRLKFADFTELTIASGAITVTQPLHTVDTESNAASDDLDTVTAAVGSGEIVHLRAENAARTVVVKHGTGNIVLSDNADFSLDEVEKSITLIRKGSSWYELARAAGASAQDFDTVYTNTADLDAATSSSTSEVDVVSAVSIPSSFWVSGRAIVIHGWASIKSSGSPTLTLRIKVGSTILSTAISPGTDDHIAFSAIIICRATGGSGSLMGTWWSLRGTTTNTPSMVFNPGDQAGTSSSPVTVDLTTAQDFKITAQYSASHANNLFRMRNIVVHRM